MSDNCSGDGMLMLLLMIMMLMTRTVPPAMAISVMMRTLEDTGVVISTIICCALLSTLL